MIRFAEGKEEEIIQEKQILPGFPADEAVRMTKESGPSPAALRRDTQDDGRKAIAGCDPLPQIKEKTIAGCDPLPQEDKKITIEEYLAENLDIPKGPEIMIYFGPAAIDLPKIKNEIENTNERNAFYSEFLLEPENITKKSEKEKEKRRLYLKKYYEDHREELILRQKKYNEDRKEEAVKFWQPKREQPACGCCNESRKNMKPFFIEDMPVYACEGCRAAWEKFIAKEEAGK